jgi:hypothetical protein
MDSGLMAGFIGFSQLITTSEDYVFAVLHTKKKTPWSESASELYRPSDRFYTLQKSKS